MDATLDLKTIWKTLLIGACFGGAAVIAASSIMMKSEKKRARVEEKEEEEEMSPRDESIAARLGPQKLVLVVHGGLIRGGKKSRKMQEGKMAAQCCHAAVGCCMASQNSLNYKVWNFRGAAKIALKTAPSEQWLKIFRGHETDETTTTTNADEGTQKKKQGKHKNANVATEKEHLAYLHSIQKEAKAAGLKTYLVQDAGHTQLDPGTTTVLGIGPAPVPVIDAITGKSGLYPCRLVQ